jgi:hypothetical protein
MPDYNAKTVLARYGKIMNITPTDPEVDEAGTIACVVDPALMHSEESLICESERGCDACCMSVVATVADANKETSIRLNIIDTCAISNTMTTLPAPDGHEN